MSDLASLIFFSLSLHWTHKIGEDISHKPIVPIVDVITGQNAREHPLIHQELTAVFEFDSGEHLLMHWPIRGYEVTDQDWSRMFLQQAESFNAQLRVRSIENRVRWFDVYNPGHTRRYTVPWTMLESVMNGHIPDRCGLRVKKIQHEGTIDVNS